MSGKGSQKGNVAAVAQKLAAGIQKHFAATASIVVAEGTFTPAQIAAELEKLATLRSAVEAAKALLKGAISDETKQMPELRAFYSAVIGYVRAAYGSSPAILADFGLAPKKARKAPSVEQQAAAAAKRASTRAARGTMGKKKKAAIRGNVSGVVVTPVTVSPNPVHVAPATAPTPTNATSAPTAGSGAGSAASATNGAVNGTAAAH